VSFLRLEDQCHAPEIPTSTSPFRGLPLTSGRCCPGATRTAEELSIVCPADQAPANAKCESSWTCFKLEGPFPFALTGVLASFIDPLAQRGVAIFAVSTFDTDYVLVKEEHLAAALEALRAAGHELIS
jgi:uncharacterized protein